MWLSPVLHCLTWQQRIKTASSKPCSASEQRKMDCPSMQQPQGRSPLRKRKAFQSKELTAAASFESCSLSSVSRASTDLKFFSPLTSPVNLHSVSDVILLVFLKSLILCCTVTIACVYVTINALTNAVLCLSNLEIREAANSEDQTLHTLAAEILCYNLSETTGLLINQIHTPYSINNEQPRKSSGGR